MMTACELIPTVKEMRLLDPGVEEVIIKKIYRVVRKI
jgi:hypothetical protein